MQRQSNFVLSCQRNFYWGQAGTKKLYEGAQTDVHVYTESSRLISMANTQLTISDQHDAYLSLTLKQVQSTIVNQVCAMWLAPNSFLQC